MPTIFVFFGLRFVFFSNDHELKLADMVIEENKEVIIEHWNNFFNKNDGNKN
jgi:hypothetical protein